jgi:hypothetical protein
MYDLSINPAPPQIKEMADPMLVFIPAFSKKPPFLIYTDSAKALTIMEYIETHSDIKFKLPELPHLPPELHEEYYRVSISPLYNNP